MSRPLRIEYPGAFYHLTSRGNAKMPIFDDDEDRECFIVVLEDVVKQFNWVVHAYCVMDNHYHLLVETVDGILSKGMRLYTLSALTVGTIVWDMSFKEDLNLFL